MSRHDTRLRDLIHAYKGLQKEKDALAASLAALTASNESNESKEEGDSTSNEQVVRLTRALTDMTAEKERLEGAYRVEKKKMLSRADADRQTIDGLQRSVEELRSKAAKEASRLASVQREKELLAEVERLRLSEQSKQTLLTLRSEEHLEQMQKARDEVSVLGERLARTEHDLRAAREAAPLAAGEVAGEARLAETQWRQRQCDELETRVSELSTLVGDYERQRVVDQERIRNLEETLERAEEAGEVSNEAVTYDTRAVHDAGAADAAAAEYVLAATEWREVAMATEERYRQLQATLNSTPHVSETTTTHCEATTVSAQSQSDESSHDLVLELRGKMEQMEREHEDQMRETKAAHESETVQLRRQLQRSRERALQMVRERDGELMRLRGMQNGGGGGSGGGGGRGMGRVGTSGRGGGLMGVLVGDGAERALEEREEEEKGGERGDEEAAVEVEGVSSDADVLVGRVREGERRLHEILELLRDAELRERHLNDQTVLLKEELRRLERNQTRESVNLEYVKNVLLRLFACEPDQVERLAAALMTILEFSPAEKRSVLGLLRERSADRKKRWW